MTDFSRLQERYEDFWARRNRTPILLLSGMRGAPDPVPAPERLEDRWLDTAYLVGRERARLAASFFLGDAFPLVNPNLGPDFFGATFGAGLRFEETTSFAVPFVEDWTEELSFSEDNFWWKKMLEITEAFVEDSRGAYMVGVTDLHFGVDGLVSLRGPENLCCDAVDRPEVFDKARTVLLPAFRRQFEALSSLTQRYLPGSSNWMGLYKREPWYVTSCDFICMISKEHFAELILPELREELAYLGGNTIFHLDGPGALRHLDALLELPDLTGVQWVYGAGQPSARHWLDVLHRIQDAGKLVNVALKREDVVPVLSALRPEGLSCSFDFAITEGEAGEILDLAQRLSRR